MITKPGASPDESGARKVAGLVMVATGATGRGLRWLVLGSLKVVLLFILAIMLFGWMAGFLYQLLETDNPMAAVNGLPVIVVLAFLLYLFRPNFLRRGRIRARN